MGVNCSHRVGVKWEWLGLPWMDFNSPKPLQRNHSCVSGFNITRRHSCTSGFFDRHSLSPIQIGSAHKFELDSSRSQHSLPPSSNPSLPSSFIQSISSSSTISLHPPPCPPGPPSVGALIMVNPGPWHSNKLRNGPRWKTLSSVPLPSP